MNEGVLESINNILSLEVAQDGLSVHMQARINEEKLNHLREIEHYLNRTIDEHQRILNSHFDLKAVYTRELEALSQMSLIKRFPLRAELYDKVLENPKALENLDYFLRPLFNREIDKSYNINKAFELQRPVRKKEEKDSTEQIDFDEEEWEAEQERIRREKLKKYEESLRCVLRMADESGSVSLGEIKENILEDESLKDKLIPNVEIFKEVMVELIRNREIDIMALKKERSEFIQDRPIEFQLNEMILHLVEEYPENSGIVRISTYRAQNGGTVIFEDVMGENGERKNIKCSNVMITVERKQ